MARNGLNPVRIAGGGYNTGGVNAYAIANGTLTAALFKGDPVMLSAGTVVPSGGTQTKALGVIRGFFYMDASNTGKPRFTDQVPVSVSSYNSQSIDGFTSPVAYVVDDPNATFQIPSDATVSAGDVGQYFQVSIGAGSTQSGISNARLNVSSRSAVSTDRLVKVIGLAKMPGNAWDAASDTVVEVRFVNHQNRNAI